MELHEQMLSGAMYNDLNEELVNLRQRAILLTNEYNASFGRRQSFREEVLQAIVGKLGKNVHFEPNFRCEFGHNITIGDNFYANFNCTMLDAHRITLGNNVLIGPHVGLYTANHAIHPAERRAGGCYAKPITIGDNVWIGGGVQIMGGVTIGNDSIIGAGSVVTQSIPAGVIAAGVPCRVIRPITEADRTGYIPENC